MTNGSDSQTSQLERLQGMQSDNTEFHREIGLFGGVSILGGIMIGSGIFYLGSYVLMRSGMSLGLSILCWIVGGLVTLLSGLCYAELGAMIPRAGGSYVYLREAFGPAIAFMSGFSGFLLGSSGSIASLALALAGVIAGFFPGLLEGFQVKLVAIAFIVFLTFVHTRGIKLGSRIQNVFMVAKLVPIAIIIVLGLLIGRQPLDLSLIPAQGGTPALGWAQMLALGVVATLWAYEGWGNLNTVSEEMKNPKRNLPLAIVLAILGVMGIYVLFNIAVYRTLPVEQISTMLANGEFYLGSEAARTLLGDSGMILVSIGMLVAIFGALNGCVMVFPRSYYAMAMDGASFTSFKKLHPQYRTPINAQLASMAVSILLVLSRNLDQLTSLVVFSSMIYSVLTFYAVIRFRQRFPQLERPYRVPFFPSTVYLTIAIMIALMLNSFVDDPFTSLIGLGVPAVGYLIYRFSNRSVPSEAAVGARPLSSD